MSVKDKIIFGILVILIAVAGYFQYMASNMISRMDELNENDSKHVDVVHNEFREDLRKLTLKFIGRGKHLQKAQQDIVANTEFIEYVTDSLGNAIQLVQYNLDELDRTVSKKFDNVEQALNYLAKRKDIKNSMEDMKADSRDPSNWDLDPNTYPHNTLIDNVMNQARSKAWAKLNDPSHPGYTRVQALKSEKDGKDSKTRDNRQEILDLSFPNKSIDQFPKN